MADKIKLVAGDTRPFTEFSLTDDTTKLPIDLSAAGTTVVLKFRAVGSTTIKATLACQKLVGIVLDDGSVSSASPYNIVGSGGRCYAVWTALALDTAGDYEGEVEITFSDGTVQTVFDLLQFKVRAQF